MLMNFFVKIVNATAQRYLKKQQDNEIAALKNKSSEHSDDWWFIYLMNFYFHMFCPIFL